MAAFQRMAKTAEQTPLRTVHGLHGGMYTRTIHLDGGMVLTGVEIKISTVLIVDGCAEVWTGTEWRSLSGHSVLFGSPCRQQVFVTTGPTSMTMVFPTHARTIDEAEREFTDDVESLISRTSASDTVFVTGE